MSKSLDVKSKVATTDEIDKMKEGKSEEREVEQ